MQFLAQRGGEIVTRQRESMYAERSPVYRDGRSAFHHERTAVEAHPIGKGTGGDCGFYCGVGSDHQRTHGEAVRRDGRYDAAVKFGLQDRTADGEIVTGGAGGCGDDQAVGQIVCQKISVDACVDIYH